MPVLQSPWQWSVTGQVERIVVVGTSGSGKTTTARRLAEIMGVGHTEMDALYWGPNWTPVPREVFRERVTSAMQPDAWVIDGNYGSDAQGLILPRATTLVWLDYSLSSVMWQLWWRTTRRYLSGEVLWSGNRESFYTTFFTSKSIFWWALTSHRRNHRKYSAMSTQPDHPHLRMIRLGSPDEARRWLDWVARTAKTGVAAPATRQVSFD